MDEPHTTRLSKSFTIILCTVLFIIQRGSTPVKADVAYVCEDASLNLECTVSEEYLRIIYVSYGHRVPDVVPSELEHCSTMEAHDEVCHANSSMEVVWSACETATSCQVDASNSVFGDPCPGQRKFLEVEFECSRRCEVDWKYYAPERKCIFFNDNSLAFDAASNDCIAVNATLTSIHSAEETNFILENIDSSAWFGLTSNSTDQGEENLFFLDGSPVIYSAFADIKKQEGYDCAKVTKRGRRWRWALCARPSHSVCMKDAIHYNQPAPQTVAHRAIMVGTTSTHEPIQTTELTGTTLTKVFRSIGAMTGPRTTSEGVATTTIAAEGRGLLLQLYLVFLNHDVVEQYTFSVNDTVLMSILTWGSFTFTSVEWTVKNHFTSEPVIHTANLQESLIVRFTTPSIYTVTAIAYSNTSMLSAAVNATVVPTTKILCQSPAYVGIQTWCSVVADVPHENLSKYVFSFGDDQRNSTVTAELEAWELFELPDGLVEYAAAFSGHFVSFMSYNYLSSGTYNLSASVYQSLAAKVQVNVTIKTHCITKVNFLNGVGNITHPFTHQRSQELLISASMAIDEECIDPMTSEFNWQALAVTAHGDIVRGFEKTTFTPRVTIPSLTLECNDYRLTLQIRTSDKGSEELLSVEYITTWLRIQPSPLVAVISGGSLRSHGIVSNLVLDGSDSLDPDLPQGVSSGLNYSWYCMEEDSDLSDMSLTEALQHPERACFGDSVTMDTTSSFVEISSETLVSGVVLHFWIVVGIEGRTEGTAEQRVSLMNGALPELEISCMRNCEDYFHPTERLVLFAECTNCEDESLDVSFTWTETTEVLEGDWSSKTTTGLAQAYLVIKENSFSSFAQAGRIIFRVLGNMPNSTSSGFAEFTAHFASPPTLGACSVSPNSGFALKTAFTVSCEHFSDPNAPLSYIFDVFDEVESVQDETEGFRLYEGTDSHPGGLFLPVGDGAHNYTVLLKITVENIYKASTTVFMNATVMPPRIGGAGNVSTELLNMTSSVETEVATFLAAGDTGHAAQVIKAFGSVLNSVEDADQEVKDTREGIRSTLINAISEIPVESMTSLGQVSDALAVVTSNEHEIPTDTQVKAASTVYKMASYLKSESRFTSQDQGTIALASSILVEGLSNIISAAVETEKMAVNVSRGRSGPSQDKNLTDAALSAVDDIQTALVEGMLPSEEATVIASPSLSVAVRSISLGSISGASLGGWAGEGSMGRFSMPAEAGSLSDALQSVNGTAVSLQMSTLKWNPFRWDVGDTSVNSSIVGIQLKTDDHIVEAQGLSDYFSIYLPVTESVSVKPIHISVTKDFSASLLLSNASSTPGGAYYLQIVSMEEPLVALSVCVANISVNATQCVENSTLVYAAHFNESTVDVNLTWSISSEALQGADGIFVGLYDGPGQLVYASDNISLSVYMYSSQCIFWDEEENSWDTTGCKVGSLSSMTSTHCLCNHLSFFGSSLLVPPNKVNLFSDAKLFLTFVENPIVVTFVAIILALYVVLAVWAWRKDRRDARLAAVIVLEDNDPFHHYRYAITFVTGMRRGAGTTSTVTLTLTGKQGHSEPHVLQSRSRPVLTRGSTDSFLLTAAECLGDIQAIRLWHNNGGSSPHWYVNHCIVHDLETDKRFFFICNTWVMIGEGSTGLDQTFKAASPKELHRFGHVFTTRTVRDLRDGHLWLSVLTRPKHSNFTCLQRVSCCLSLLMCSMMTSIMFYGIPDDPADQVMDFGSFRITIREIIISIESSIIAFPINLIIVSIFRHIRPSKLKAPALKDKYVVKGTHEPAVSVSTVSSSQKVSPKSDENRDMRLRSSTTTHNTGDKAIQEDYHDQHSQQPASVHSKHWVGGGDSSSTSASEDNARDRSDSSFRTVIPSQVTLDSALFNAEMNKFMPRSLSAVMSEWGRDKNSVQVELFGHGGLDRVDIPIPSDHTSTTIQGSGSGVSNESITASDTAYHSAMSQMKVSTSSSDHSSQGDHSSQRDGFTHNFFLYSHLMKIVQDLAQISPERFSQEEEHKQAMREAQTLVMTAVTIATPSASREGSLCAHDLEKKVRVRRGIGKLPYSCVYLGWLLLVFTVLASSYVTMLYGLKYGKQQSIDWLVSLFFATFQSIFFIQPVKVLFFAIFVSLIFKQLDPEEDFSDEIEEIDVENADVMHTVLQQRRMTVHHYKPPAKADITHHLRNKHLKERMYALLWQIAGYLCFFYLLMTITYTQVDRNAYFLNKGTRGLFFHNKDYRLMNDFRSFLKWADSTLLPGLLDEDRWGAEKQSHLIGGGLRLRQVRVKPSSCKTNKLFEDIINDCRASFSPEDEDRSSYNGSWTHPLLSTGNPEMVNVSVNASEEHSPWHYMTDNSVSMMGVTTTFHGSGFVWMLGSSYMEAKESLANMSQALWLDEHTRALFVEWTVYNANTNLFCVVTFLMETPASGGLLKFPEVQSVRLYRYAANYKLFVIICEILFVLSVWFVIYREYLRYKPIGLCRYLSDKWNLLEVAIILNCFISAGIYIYRYLITKSLFQEMRGEFTYISFRTAAGAANALVYSLAMIVILSCIKFLYLLRLNPRLYLLTTVMSDCYHEVCAFSFLLFILIVCYALPMSIIFQSLYGYRNAFHAIITIFITLPGNFVYSDLQTVHAFLGPLMLLTFQYWSCFLFLDLLISALNESMKTIRRDPPPPSESRMIGLLLLSKILSLIGIPQRFHLGMDD